MRYQRTHNAHADTNPREAQNGGKKKTERTTTEVIYRERYDAQSGCGLTRTRQEEINQRRPGKVGIEGARHRKKKVKQDRHRETEREAQTRACGSVVSDFILTSSPLLPARVSIISWEQSKRHLPRLVCPCVSASLFYHRLHPFRHKRVHSHTKRLSRVRIQEVRGGRHCAGHAIIPPLWFSSNSN